MTKPTEDEVLGEILHTVPVEDYGSTVFKMVDVNGAKQAIKSYYAKQLELEKLKAQQTELLAWRCHGVVACDTEEYRDRLDQLEKQIKEME